MTKLKIIDGAAAEPPVEGAPLSPARARLAAAIAERPGLTAATEEISGAQRKLATLVVAETKAADAVAALEAALADRALAWARSGQSDPPSIANGADLFEARELLAKAQAQAEAARAAAPALMREMQAALARRTALEETIKQRLVLDVLVDEADAIAARIAEHEREIASEVARLAAMRRPIARLVGFQSKPVNALNLLIGERGFDEAQARALESRFQKLADDLTGGDAGASLEGA
jgi:hypothetical protein